MRNKQPKRLKIWISHLQKRNMVKMDIKINYPRRHWHTHNRKSARKCPWVSTWKLHRSEWKEMHGLGSICLKNKHLLLKTVENKNRNQHSSIRSKIKRVRKIISTLGLLPATPLTLLTANTIWMKPNLIWMSSILTFSLRIYHIRSKVRSCQASLTI